MLTPEQERFKNWIEARLPFLAHLFDWGKAEFLPSEVEKYLGVSAHGQSIMARFALGIWCGNDRYNFDFIEAARTLDDELMAVVTEWMEAPFFP